MLTGYTLVFIKLTLGILALILQMNLMGKGNLAPNSALDQVQNYVLGGIIGAVSEKLNFDPHYQCCYLQ